MWGAWHSRKGPCQAEALHAASLACLCAGRGLIARWSLRLAWTTCARSRAPRPPPNSELPSPIRFESQVLTGAWALVRASSNSRGGAERVRSSARVETSLKLPLSVLRGPHMGNRDDAFTAPLGLHTLGAGCQSYLPCQNVPWAETIPRFNERPAATAAATTMPQHRHHWRCGASTAATVAIITLR